MAQVKFYRVETLPEVGEVGSLYFVYGSGGEQARLCLCVGNGLFETYTSEHQDISGKVNVADFEEATLVTSAALNTLNLNLAVKESDILLLLTQSLELQNLISTLAASMYKGVPVVSQTTDATIAPNVWNVWGEVTSLNITKGTEIAGIVNNFMVRFTAGEGCIVNFLDFTLQWYGGGVPEWAAGSTYEISIVDNIALWAEFEPAS